MTDFRRPDLDLWDEEDDADDARPTIVAERPTADQPNVRSPAQRVSAPERGASGATAAARSSLVQRLIEQGELDEEAARNSAESLRNSEVDSLTLIDDKEPFSAAFAARRDELTREAARRSEIAQVESESATEDAVPTVSVKRPLPNSPTPLPTPAPLAKLALTKHAAPDMASAPAIRAAATASKTPVREEPAVVESATSVASSVASTAVVASATPAPSAIPVPKLTTPPPAPPRADREVTERISIPGPGMIGSIAPTSRTARPTEREAKGGMPLWQGALAAALLLGGGFAIVNMRSGRQVTATSIASTDRPGIEEPAAAPQRAEPAPALAEPALPNTPAVEAPPAEPAPVAPALAEATGAAAPAPTAPVAAPAQQVPSSLPEPILPKPSKDEPTNAIRRTRAAKVERRALAASAEETVATAPAAPTEEPVVAVPAAEPESTPKPAAIETPASSADLPAKPSREQVTAALNAVLPELQRCVGDRHDTADVTLTVRPGGFVSYAVVAGPYAGSAEGSCIARAVKAAKFPAFSDPSLRITYPFQL